MSGVFFTIGMAGHIDHGKTTLTKALTNVDTDRLKEEKLRNISIEPGYAPIDLEKDKHVSVIDVPGHERFIRQMIAGVAGIDLIILVVAADEGVMPQTREHAEILGYLGIKHALIAVTKSNKVDEDMLILVEDDIQSELKATVFEKAPLYFVDSVAKIGIDQLKEGIKQALPKTMERNPDAPLRLPIDQAFTLRGKGTIVRGTVFDGAVKVGDQLTLMPSKINVRVRQLQVHKQTVEEAVAGQRVAINISGINAGDVKRGDILTGNVTITPSTVVDLVLHVRKEPNHPLKQRQRVKIHTNTSEVSGSIVYFDRNELSEKNTQEVLCQLRLDEPIAVLRGDRFIIRRPSPAETIGGGWILDPDAKRYKFGNDTIKMLTAKKEGTPEQRVLMSLQKLKIATIQELSKQIGETENEIIRLLDVLAHKNQILKVSGNRFTLTAVVDNVCNSIYKHLAAYHQGFPMRLGLPKAELVQESTKLYPALLVEHAVTLLVEKHRLIQAGPLVALSEHEPSFPKEWEKRLSNVLLHLKEGGMKHEGLRQMFEQQRIPEQYYSELARYLIDTQRAVCLDDGTFVHQDVFNQAVRTLFNFVPEGAFTVQDAKSALELSRKYCILFLERLDALGITVRRENERRWVSHKIGLYIS